MKVSYLADCPQVADTIAQWYFDEWSYMVPGTTIDEVRDKVKLKAQSRYELPLIIVVHSEQTLVAAAELKFREHPEYPQYEHWLGGVYVSENERGQGYSSLLIDQAKKHMTLLSVDTLYLQCEQKNLDLYLKHGFHVLHDATYKGVKTTIMSWSTNT